MKITRILLPALAALALPALLAAQEPAGAPAYESVSATVDSAVVAGELARLAAAREPAAEWTFAITWPPSGIASRVQMYFSRQEPAGPQAEVARILLANARRRPPAREPQIVAITAVPGRRAVLRVPLESQPVPLNRRAIERGIARASERLVRADSGLRATRAVVMVRMRLGADGVPGGITVVPPAGNPEIEQEAVRGAELLRFRPAMIEGRPVAVWIQLPLTFEFR
ncbi:TonB family protein [Longimicrobium terrae]|uniref:TonB family protein n=1 Tax=Longimicrobium terrae TaxID=1639882 RepID=A0A841H690_9BACT|nr:TonB family protein [Longimicrobium terrae]MBB4639010.1 TonB family protein [Longimicrobium terrae]MBB6073249.1 TonB family protein [Longimicrobium terrae]NNC32300.1 TonB family protein [Longimicrobium terrae]